ncbi:nucleoside hydrolase [Larkinella arboricola]
MRTFFLASLLVIGLLSGPHPSSAQSPVPVILDTDMDSDVDDVGALAMLHAYERAGKAQILGVIVTSDEAYSAACTDAINTFFGRGNLPIGVSQRDSLRSFSKYTQAVAQEFPHKVTNSTAEDATTVYRRLLAAQADGSVVIITIGHLTSLSRLLNSGPDAASPLDGRALVARKVKRWSCMGGQFPKGKEANFYRPDPASTVNCLRKWTLPVTFAGWEVGQQIVTGGGAFRERCPQTSPVYRGYEKYNGFQGRASWDQVAVLEAVEGIEPYFSVEKGQCIVAADGSNEWRSTPQTNHQYLKITGSPEVVQQRIETLMLGR